MSSGAFGKDKSSSKSRVQIPEFLQPFTGQAGFTAEAALNRLTNRLAGAGAKDLVAPFTEAQETAQDLGIRRALGEGGFFPVAQNTLLRAAEGVGLDDFLPGAATDALTSSAGGTGLESFIDADALETLRSGTGGDPILRELLDESGVAGQDLLSSLSGDTSIPGVSRDALERTAAGDFLFGGEGFDQAVDAAVRAATPGILRTFGSAGVGGATGGLARTAIGQAGIDAFARQYGQERDRQLSAADRLAGLERSDIGQRADIASRIADIDLADTGQTADIAGLLNSLKLDSASALAGLSDAERDRGQLSASILADLGLAERSNALDAARDLPALATADVELLNRIGTTQQEFDQTRLDAPNDALLQLLSASLAGLPISSFLGSDSKGKRSAFQLGFADGG